MKQKKLLFLFIVSTILISTPHVYAARLSRSIDVDVIHPGNGEQFYTVEVSGNGFLAGQSVGFYLDTKSDNTFLGAAVTMKGRFIFTFVMPYGSPGEHTLHIAVWSQGGSITPGLTQSTTIDTEWLEETFILPVTTPMDDRLVDLIQTGFTGIDTTLQSINTFLVNSILEIAGKINQVDDQLASMFTDDEFFGDQDCDGMPNYRDSNTIWSLISIRNTILTKLNDLEEAIQVSDNHISTVGANQQTLYSYTETFPITSSGYHTISIESTESYAVKAVYIETIGDIAPGVGTDLLELTWSIRMKSGSDTYQIEQTTYHQEFWVSPRFELLSNLELNLEPTGTWADTLQIGLFATGGKTDGTEYVNVRVIIETTRDADCNLTYN